MSSSIGLDMASRAEYARASTREMTETRPDLLYVLSHGFAARMVLQSDLLPALRERGVHVAVLSPSADKDYFRARCERHGATAIHAPDVSGRWLGQYAQARRYLFEDYEKNAALRSKHLWDIHHPDVHPVLRARSMFGKAVNAAFLRAPALAKLASSAEQRLLRSASLRSLLGRLRPRLVVATYPVAWLEALAILESRELGIPTVGQLLSWDNITCKGRFAAIPDSFISWGPIMTAELGAFYGTGPERVLEAGVAHFDLHTRPVHPAELAGHLRGLGLDPAKPYLFLGMSASYFAPKEIDIVDWLASRVRAGDFGAGVQLLVRPHPQNIRGPMADARIISRLQGIAGGSVVVDLPDVVSDNLDMGDKDMARLAALLHGAAVTLNSGSTLTIDSLIHDRPVILTTFDADADLPWYQSARRLSEFPHLDKLLSYGGVRVARSFDDLGRLIRDYLADPTKDRAARQAALQAEVGATDGRACIRIADGLAAKVAEARGATAPR